jgi:hypothetical protein
LMCITIKSCAAPRSLGFFAILAFRGQFITPTTDFMHDWFIIYSSQKV